MGTDASHDLYFTHVVFTLYCLEGGDHCLLDLSQRLPDGGQVLGHLQGDTCQAGSKSQPLTAESLSTLSRGEETPLTPATPRVKSSQDNPIILPPQQLPLS